MYQLVCLITILISNVYCANILFIDPLPSPSHYIWNKALSTELVKKGHNVTIITHDSDTTSILKNYTVITMEGFYDFLHKKFALNEFISESNILNVILQYAEFGELLCNYDFNTQGFKHLMNYPENFKFDLILYDITHPICLYGLIQRFSSPPVIGVTAFSLAPYLSYRFGNALYPSYMPYYCTKFTNHMNFKERFLNLVYSWLDMLIYKYISISKQIEIGKLVFGESFKTSFEKIERNISLFLINTDPVLDYPIPLSPNIIPVGGLQIKPGKTLPDDLESIVSKATHGVILFSLGTNIKSDFLTKDSIAQLLNAFAKLKQIVLWKFETGELTNLPKNVFIKKWLPQNDILAHAKTKLFITHCGSLGTQEAMYHGVPMVGIPIFVDQNLNGAKLVQKQVGAYLDYKNLTFDNIYAVLTEVLENPIYANNVKKISQIYRSKPQTALETGIFWIEHVLKHGNVEYLNIPARDMYTYEVLSLDIIAFVIFIIIVIYLLLKMIIQLVLHRVGVSTRKTTKEKAM